MAAATSTVHIVEDDPSVAKALSRLIRSAGFDVETFLDAESYLAGRIAPPQCLIVDIGLPGMSGLELAALLAQRPIDFSVIVISSEDSDLVRRSARTVGASGFFAKPLADDRFLQAVESSITRPTEQRGAPDAGWD